VLEALHLATGRAAYRILFEFWLKIFGNAFGLGVVSGLVMAFEFGPAGANSCAYRGRYRGRF
jgi:cytochrome bd ubiquinol oxidase subunit I